jgi:putative salt-induced outer membrane protein YdiY
MFESLWIVLTLLQPPVQPPVQVGVPEDVYARLQPGIDVSTHLAPANQDPVEPAAAPVAAGVTPATAPSEPEPKPPTPAPRVVRGRGEVSYVSTGGTAETQTIGSAGELIFTPGPWRLESKVAYLRNEVNGEVRARRLTGQLRSSRRIGERSELFGRAVYLRNTFAGISASVDAAAGVTAILLQANPHRLAIDSGFGYLTEDRTQGLGRDLATLDFGLRYQWDFSTRNRFTNDAAIKADVERTSDWRLIHIAAIQAGLNSILSLKLSHELNYRNEPVPGFTRADTVASASIVATF